MRNSKGKADCLDAAIGQKLFDLRKRLGISQHGFAQHFGVSYQQVQKYEKGTNRVSLSLAVRISRTLNVPLQELIPDFEHVSHAESQADPLVTEMLEAFGAISDKSAKKCMLMVARSFAATG